VQNFYALLNLFWSETDMWCPSCNVALEQNSKSCINCKADFSNPLGWKMLEKPLPTPPIIRPAKAPISVYNVAASAKAKTKKKRRPKTMGDYAIELVAYTGCGILVFGVLFVSCFGVVRG
jgi:hypothetical protein